MKKIRVTQRSAEWYDLRSRKIGASDAPVIMQVDPWRTPLQLFNEKMGIQSSRSNFAMKRGIQLEDEARLCFEKMSGLYVFPTVVQHDSESFMIASLDGMTMDETEIVEIKVGGKQLYSLAVKGIVPEHYQWQIQHQLYVTGLSKALYFVYDGSQGIIIEVKKNEEMQERFIPKERAFFTDLINGNPPKPEKKDITIRKDALWEELCNKLISLKSSVEEFESTKQQLIALSEGKNCRGYGVQINHSYRKGSIDIEQISRSYCVDLEKFRKSPISCCRVLICNANEQMV